MGCEFLNWGRAYALGRGTAAPGVEVMKTRTRGLRVSPRGASSLCYTAKLGGGGGSFCLLRPTSESNREDVVPEALT